MKPESHDKYAKGVMIYTISLFLLFLFILIFRILFTDLG